MQSAVDGILHSREWPPPYSNYADPGFSINSMMMKVMVMLTIMMMMMKVMVMLMLMMVMMKVILMRMASANYADLDILSLPNNLCLTLKYFLNIIKTEILLEKYNPTSSTIDPDLSFSDNLLSQLHLENSAGTIFDDIFAKNIDRDVKTVLIRCGPKISPWKRKKSSKLKLRTKKEEI